jgi:hypothetical protein
MGRSVANRVSRSGSARAMRVVKIVPKVGAMPVFVTVITADPSRIMSAELIMNVTVVLVVLSAKKDAITRHRKSVDFVVTQITSTTVREGSALRCECRDIPIYFVSMVFTKIEKARK